MSPADMVLVSSVSLFLGNGILVACVLGCVVAAWRQGFFCVTLVGMGVLIALVLALAGAGELARALVASDMSPRHAPVLAYGVIFASVVIAVITALNQWVPEQAVWNGTVPGRLVGIGVGAVTGMVLAGSILIGWSMAAGPYWSVLQPRDLAFDAGRYALQAASRFIERDRGRREAILGGWQRFQSNDPGVRPDCSEPFVDANQNCIRDEHERYLDIDGDGQFTLLVPVRGPGLGAADRWVPGMLDCYSMGSWLDVTASHAPRLTSPAEAVVDVDALGGGLYQATAVDPDPCDRLRYDIVQLVPQVETTATIDPDTGAVKLTEAAIQEVQPLYTFTVTATDQSGLRAELPVRVKVRNLPNIQGR